MAADNWQRLVTDQIPGLRRYARALVHDKHRADDLVQDVLERACRKIELWEPGTNLRAWLFTIMHNLFVNSIRKYARESAVIVVADVDADTDSAPVRREDPLALHDLVRGLQALPAEQREVLLLAGLKQLSYKEISEVLDIPLGTVMSRLSRSRERLRVLMSDESNVTMRRVK